MSDYFANSATPDLFSWQQPPPPTGQQLKIEALDDHERRRSDILLAGRRALLQHLLSGYYTATADDVRTMIEIPEDIDPVCLGPLTRPLVRLGIVVADGFTQSVRRESHARPITVWRLADREGAIGWLSANPAVDDQLRMCGFDNLNCETDFAGGGDASI